MHSVIEMHMQSMWQINKQLAAINRRMILLLGSHGLMLS
jgi:hypothetical protein